MTNEQAVNVIRMYSNDPLTDTKKENGYIEAMNQIIDAIEDGYTLTRDRGTAEWMTTSDGYPYCSKCKKEVWGRNDVAGFESNYCPYCGAVMYYKGIKYSDFEEVGGENVK